MAPDTPPSPDKRSPPSPTGAFDSTSSRNRGSQREKDELLTLLKEERYFVVLMAFDYESVRKGKPMLAWSTRYSIRAAGQNFETAITSMNQVASDYFGKNLPKLTRKRDDDSSVEIGEIEVIGQEPN